MLRGIDKKTIGFYGSAILFKLTHIIIRNKVQLQCNEKGVKGNKKVLVPISLRFTPVSLRVY